MSAVWRGVASPHSSPLPDIELTDHHAAAHVAGEPEDQENNQYKTEQSAACGVPHPAPRP